MCDLVCQRDWPPRVKAQSPPEPARGRLHTTGYVMTERSMVITMSGHVVPGEHGATHETVDRVSVTNSAGPSTSAIARALSPARARWVLLSLALGGFAVGCTEFGVLGLLPDFAQSLLPELYRQSPHYAESRAGWLISAYALGVVVGAPAIGAVAGRLPRRRLLLMFVAVFTVGTVATAAAPSFGYVLVARFVAALPHGACFGIASLVAASVVGPEKRGRGIAFVLSGLAIANVAGVPLITWLGQTISWRFAYLVVAALFASAFVAILSVVPHSPGDPNATVRHELEAFGRLQVWLTFFIGAVGFSGFFAVYSYLAPVVTKVAGLPAGAVPLILVISGIGMAVGNQIGGRLSDHSPPRAIVLSFVILLGGLVLQYLTASTPAGLIASIFVITCAAFALAVAVQARLMDAAHDSHTVGAALIHSALNAANALGAFLGGLTIAAGYGYLSPALIGLALGTIGLALTLVALHLDRAKNRTQST